MIQPTSEIELILDSTDKNINRIVFYSMIWSWSANSVRKDPKVQGIWNNKMSLLTCVDRKKNVWSNVEVRVF